MKLKDYWAHLFILKRIVLAEKCQDFKLVLIFRPADMEVDHFKHFKGFASEALPVSEGKKENDKWFTVCKPQTSDRGDHHIMTLSNKRLSKHLKQVSEAGWSATEGGL